MYAHRTEKLKIYGVELDKLENGRVRTTVRCEQDNNTEGWYFKYENTLWADYDTLATAEFDLDAAPFEAEEDVYFPDQRLRRVSLKFLPNKATPVVEFVYETITSSFVQTKDDTVDYELNGLRRVSRELIARPGTEYAKVVGTTSIDHAVNSEATKKLYLATVNINDEDGARTVNEVWIEPGLISKTVTGRADGLVDTSKTFFHTVESTPSGSVLLTRTDQNVNGFPTITVVFRSIPANGYSYTTTSDFTIPGIVTTETISLSSSQRNEQLDVTPPVPTTCRTTITITYQTSNTITTSGVYQPNRWTQAKISGVAEFGRPFSTTSTFMNHIRVGSGASRTQSTTAGGTVYYIQGNRIFGGTTGRIDLEGPTGDIAGTTITLSVRLDPAFVTDDGVQHFKKTTVTVDVPARGSA